MLEKARLGAPPTSNQENSHDQQQPSQCHCDRCADCNGHLRNPAIAQTTTELKSIRVVAPSIIVRPEQQSGTQIPVPRVAEKSALVKFDDLDLRLPGDQRILDERIAMTAKELCGDLDQEMPRGSPGTSGCPDKAIEESQAQVTQAVQLHSSRK